MHCGRETIRYAISSISSQIKTNAKNLRPARISLGELG